MEVDGIYRIFTRSVALHNVQYVKYVYFRELPMPTSLFCTFSIQNTFVLFCFYHLSYWSLLYAASLDKYCLSFCSDRCFVESFTFSYIGDGDTKTMLKLTNEPPYPDVAVQKIEDINHWCKKMKHRLEKKKSELKNTIIDGKKGISGAGRMTDSKTLILLLIHFSIIIYLSPRYDY